MSVATSPIYYVNGDFVPSAKAVLPVTDLAIVRGYAVFDYLRTHQGKFVTLHANIQRLRRSCRAVEINFPWTEEQFSEIILELLRRNQKDSAEEWGIRIIVSGGELDMDTAIFPKDRNKPSVIMLAEPVRKLSNSDNFLKGVKLISVDYNRTFTTVKTTNYITAILAKYQARDAKAFETLYVRNGFVSECPTSNIFAFFGDNLVTPEIDVLSGITRQLILELAKS